MEDLEQHEAKRGQQEAKRESKNYNWWSKKGHRGAPRDDKGRRGGVEMKGTTVVDLLLNGQVPETTRHWLSSVLSSTERLDKIRLVDIGYSSLTLDDLKASPMFKEENRHIVFANSSAYPGECIICHNRSSSFVSFNVDSITQIDRTSILPERCLVDNVWSAAGNNDFHRMSESKSRRHW